MALLKNAFRFMILPLCALLVIIIYSDRGRTEADTEKLQVQYFYHSPCASCKEDQKFYDLFQEQLEDVAKNQDYVLSASNVFQDDRQFLEVCDKLGLDKEKIHLPMLVIGNEYYQGEVQINSNLTSSYKRQIEHADISENNVPKESSKQEQSLSFDESGKPFYGKMSLDDSLYFAYFYTTSCSDCTKTLQFFESLFEHFSWSPVETSMVIDYHNILEPDHLKKLDELMERYNVPSNQRQVPILFFQDGYLSGYETIVKEMQNIMEDGRAKGPIPLNGTQTLPALTVGGVMAAGLMNGLNPCSISMLLFLFSLLITKKKSILKLGFSYITGKAVCYLLIGLFFYSILSFIDFAAFQILNQVISWLLIVFCLALFGLSIWDFFAAKQQKYNKIKLQLPVPMRKLNHRLIQLFSAQSSGTILLITMFALGFIISIGEFLCTGQIYVATILSLFVEKNRTNYYAFLLFAVYIVCMCIPFVLFTLVVNKGSRVLDLSEKTRRWLPYIKLISGCLFLGFAVFAFLKLI